MATFLGAFLFFTVPDFLKNTITRSPMPTWFYQSEVCSEIERRFVAPGCSCLPAINCALGWQRWSMCCRAMSTILLQYAACL